MKAGRSYGRCLFTERARCCAKRTYISQQHCTDRTTVMNGSAQRQVMFVDLMRCPGAEHGCVMFLLISVHLPATTARHGLCHEPEGGKAPPPFFQAHRYTCYFCSYSHPYVQRRSASVPVRYTPENATARSKIATNEVPRTC